MRVLDRLSVQTEEFHAKADEDVIQLLGPVGPEQYRQYLMRLHGFVVPLEKSISTVRGALDGVIDHRRFRKAEMLRIDLHALRVAAKTLEELPQCALPPFDSVEAALGWAYPIERSTLGHSNLYRHLASRMPGEVAFAGSYLKCYFGVIGESWKSYGDALDAVAVSEAKKEHVIECARDSFRAWRSWRLIHDEQVTANGESS